MVDDSAATIPAPVQEYLTAHSRLTLATASPVGLPHAASLVYVNDGLILYFCTSPETTTARFISENSAVAFTIDEYVQDWSKTKGIQGSGEAEVVLASTEISRVVQLFRAKFPWLTNVQTSNLSVVRVTPTSMQFIDNEDSGGEQAGQTLGMRYERTLVYNIFRGLPKEEVDTVSARLSTMTAAPGQVIVRQGAPADKFFIIVDGEVEVIREDGGQARTVAHLQPGHFFGEMAILRDMPRAATVQAVQPTTLLAMDRDIFRGLVAQSLDTTEDFDRIVRRRASELAETGSRS